MKTKADAERSAMMAVAKHPFEKGLLEHVSKEMEGWAYFIGNNDAANKVLSRLTNPKRKKLTFLTPTHTSQNNNFIQ